MMMAQKAALFGDTATELRIRTTPDPADQSLGRTVSGFDQECWERHRYDIVLNTNFCKFSQNPDLQQALKATGEKHIAEASPYDFIWGIGYEADHPFDCERARWRLSEPARPGTYGRPRTPSLEPPRHKHALPLLR